MARHRAETDAARRPGPGRPGLQGRLRSRADQRANPLGPGDEFAPRGKTAGGTNAVPPDRRGNVAAAFSGIAESGTVANARAVKVAGSRLRFALAEGIQSHSAHSERETKPDATQFRLRGWFITGTRH